MLLRFLDKPEIYSSIAIAIMGIILFGAIYVLNNLDSFPVWNPIWEMKYQVWDFLISHNIQ